jgi:UDP-N-acetylmuramoyl-tripeptide--D-alanyl-D-alanine ligase
VKEIDSDRKIIVLGDMLELGEREESSHKIIGKKVAEIEGSIFIAVGNRMKVAVDRFKKNVSDSQSRVYWFENSIEAGRAVQNLMRQGDLILIKGSQGMRMEKIVVEIMAEPNRKKELIVRQDKDWI